MSDGDLRPEGAGKDAGDPVCGDDVSYHCHDSYHDYDSHMTSYDPGILTCVMQRADDKAETSHHATGGSGAIRSPRLNRRTATSKRLVAEMIGAK